MSTHRPQHRTRLIERGRPFFLGVILATLGYAVHAARADGVPSMPTMFYSGTLEEGGVAVDGQRQMKLRLFDALTSDATMLCESTPNEGSGTPGEVTVRSGRFRFAVSDACVDVVRDHPNVYVELVVVGEVLPRAKVGAVPFAIEAEHAMRADVAAGVDPASPLAAQLVPQGMLAMFAGPCPNGWSEYTAMRGVFPRGEPSGDGASLDVGGSDDAVVVAHTHTASGTTATGGAHSHSLSGSTGDVNAVTTPFRIVSSGGGSGAQEHHFHGFDTVNNTFVDRSDLPSYPARGHTHAISGSTSTTGDHTHALSLTVASAGQSGIGANVPRYREVIFCRKN